MVAECTYFMYHSALASRHKRTRNVSPYVPLEVKAIDVVLLVGVYRENRLSAVVFNAVGLLITGAEQGRYLSDGLRRLLGPPVSGWAGINRPQCRR